MSWKKTIEKALTKKFGHQVYIKHQSPVSGGSINAAYRLDTTAGLFFVKINSATRFPGMFELEAKGLQLLERIGEITVPKVVCYGEDGTDAFLILNFIASAMKTENFWEDFGIRLARLHQHSDKLFGLEYDNYIGSLRQSNKQHGSWKVFFTEERLEPLAKMAFDKTLLTTKDVQKLQKFENRIEEIFPQEPPALIHGDLWSGNFMVNEKGTAVIIDPAVYFGHREMDMAMTQLFGGFPSQFYDAYHNTFPLEKGWKKRVPFCNLYPLLVHINLFGGGYVSSFRSVLQSF